MKLRISGNSIRLRLLRSEVTSFLETGRIESTIHFSANEDGFLIYALELASEITEVAVRSEPSQVIIVLPRQPAISWAETNETGIYSKVDLGKNGTLDILIEKDFACLDLSDADNYDTFPNPQTGDVC